MTRLLVLVALVICFAPGCATERTNVSQGLTISHFRAGLACPQTEPINSICTVTTTIPITGQGVCVYNEAELPCTWYGFEFDYADAKPGDALACVMVSDHNSDFGGPEGVRQPHSTRYEYSLPLEKRSGHFFNPQYVVLDPRVPSGTIVENETVCSFAGRELVRFQFHIQYQGQPAGRT